MLHRLSFVLNHRWNGSLSFTSRLDGRVMLYISPQLAMYCIFTRAAPFPEWSWEALTLTGNRSLDISTIGRSISSSLTLNGKTHKQKHLYICRSTNTSTLHQYNNVHCSSIEHLHSRLVPSPGQPSLMFDNLIKREPLITLLISRILYLVPPYILPATRQQWWWEHEIWSKESWPFRPEMYPG